ncbi:hypothetical protein [Pandoraea pnomenusa]|uniref:hypothetical protein n=1 Tax=Pandoraea pnomenusa TaxID=93220 RepID=UPI0007BCD722|nr:hypothetical protein [Pandoraea pnomenusa]ANC44258.1 hypothetical protein A6P55_08610 [Pandoraea pnomenusa]
MKSSEELRREAIASYYRQIMNPVPPAAESTLPFDAEGGEVADSDNLVGPELIYQLCKSTGYPVVGDPKSAFAMFNTCSGSLRIFAVDEALVINDTSPWGDAVLGALLAAQDEGASFVTGDGVVTCVLKDVSAQGRNYGEAAMRALVELWCNEP